MSTQKKSEQWLDDMLTQAINAPPAHFDPQQWHDKYASRLTEGGPGRAEALAGVNLTQFDSFRSFIMKSKTTKIAAALLAVIGAIAIISYTLTPSRSGVAWAQVAQQVQQARSYSFNLDMTLSGIVVEKQQQNKDMHITGSYLLSADGNIKMTMLTDAGTMDMYFNIQNNSALMLMHKEKKFMRMEFNDEMAKQMRQQSFNPRDVFKNLEGCQYEPLGFDTIDGVEVAGIECTDPKLFGNMFETVDARLWSDTRTGWPVRVEYTGTTNNGQGTMHYMISDFQWDIDIDPAQFEYAIPDDYTELPKMQMPAMNADTAVSGLKKFAEMTGAYPKSLSVMTLMKELQENTPREIQKALKEKYKTPGEKGINQDQAQAMMQEFMPIQYLGMFYMQLVQQGKDPKYYGETVTAADADAVLLRWESAPNEYTVIFGNLTTQTVTPEELAQLEKTQ